MKLMASCKTVVTPLLMHWSYCSLSLILHLSYLLNGILYPLTWSLYWNNILGAFSVEKRSLTSKGIPMRKTRWSHNHRIRWSHDRFDLIKGIPLMGKMVFILKWHPGGWEIGLLWNRCLKWYMTFQPVTYRPKCCISLQTGFRSKPISYYLVWNLGTMNNLQCIPKPWKLCWWVTARKT